MSDESIYHEVSEELRQQELAQFWKENRYWIAGGIAAAIVFTGGLSWWRDFERNTNIKATTEISAVLETHDPAKLAAHAQDAGKNHALLARFAEAQAWLDRGDKAKAAGVFREIMASGKGDDAWKDLARLYAVNAALDAGEDTAALHAEIAPLANDAENPWRYSARELDALIYAKEGRKDEAARVLGALLVDPALPPSVRTRAMTLRTLYATGAAKPGNDDKDDNDNTAKGNEEG